MKRRKTLWIICMAMLCLVLYTIVISRAENLTNVVFGGADGGYLQLDSASFIDPNATETPQPTDDGWPKIDITGDTPVPNQYGMVRDSDGNRLSAHYEPETSTIPGTYMQFSTEALPYLTAMLDDCRAAGYTVVVNAAYRSWSYQNKLFNGKASQIAAGFGVTDYLDERYQLAADEARTITMFPGSSEHQLGLAVDLADKMYSTNNYAIMNQELFAWLDEHCAEYGFIKRYPTKKMLLTGWNEPWHYRYVGVEAATYIMEHGLCYEEFYAHYAADFQY